MAVIAGENILEFIKMAEIPEIIRAKAPPCMLFSEAFPQCLFFT